MVQPLAVGRERCVADDDRIGNGEWPARAVAPIDLRQIAVGEDGVPERAPLVLEPRLEVVRSGHVRRGALQVVAGRTLRGLRGRRRLAPTEIALEPRGAREPFGSPSRLPAAFLL